MRTDFYLLACQSLQERDQFACRLIEKAFKAGQSLFVATNSDEEARHFDELLWTFRPDSFVPHSQSIKAPKTPVLIGTPTSQANTDIWLNLSEALPPAPLACQRLIEIIPKIPDLQDKARERFRQYRKLGYTLQTHHIE